MVSLSNPTAHSAISDNLRNDLMNYNKLVRDKIPEYIRKKGGTPVFHVANDKEYWVKLKEKLLEEARELKESEAIEELADLLEVIDAIIEYKKFSRRKIRNTKNKKAKERGKFRDRIILDES